MLKVEDGCVNFCTYCIIPYARGPIRSLPWEEAACEAKRLAGAGYRELVLTGIVSLEQLVNWMSTAPAERFGLARRGRLEEGYASDFTLVDLNEEYIINRNHFLSKGRNTPFHGWRVKGKIKATYVDGTCVYEEGKQ